MVPRTGPQQALHQIRVSLGFQLDEIVGKISQFKELINKIQTEAIVVYDLLSRSILLDFFVC